MVVKINYVRVHKNFTTKINKMKSCTRVLKINKYLVNSLTTNYFYILC